MYRREITYTDFNGVERTEVFAFNMTKAELARLEMEIDGGFGSFVEGISNAKNVPAIYRSIEDIINRAYGLLSDDGRYIDKSDRVLERFKSSEAYSTFVFDLINEPDLMEEFLNGIMPADWIKKADELKEQFGSYAAAKEAMENETIRYELGE